MQKIFYKKDLLAIKFKINAYGAAPLTSPKESLQLMAHRHRKGHVIKAHKHKRVKRATYRLGECLIIIKGKVKTDFFFPKNKYFKSVTVKTGEGILLLRGGHRIKFLTNAKIIEIKNGPYINDRIDF